MLQMHTSLTTQDIYFLVMADNRARQQKVRDALKKLMKMELVHKVDTGVYKYGPAYSSDNAGDGPGILGQLFFFLVMAIDKVMSMVNAAAGRRIWRARDATLKQWAAWEPAWFVWVALTLRHKTGRNYFRGAVMQLGKEFRSNNAGDGPFSLPEDCWWNIIHWELMMAVHARNARRTEAATKIQALWRGHDLREWMDDLWNESLFSVEYGIYQEEGHQWMEDTHGHVWANMCAQYVKDGVLSYEEEAAKENQFGPEYSSDNSGDGPDIMDVILDERDMEILLFRFEIQKEMFDLQVWTFGMRLYEHEYRGQPFDHHQIMGTTELFGRLSNFNDALHRHFETGGGDCWIEYADWKNVLEDLETLESADIFHDVHCQEHLQSLVTDFILFSTMDDHHFETRPADICFQIPLFGPEFSSDNSGDGPRTPTSGETVKGLVPSNFPTWEAYLQAMRDWQASDEYKALKEIPLVVIPPKPTVIRDSWNMDDGGEQEPKSTPEEVAKANTDAIASLNDYQEEIEKKWGNSARWKKDSRAPSRPGHGVYY